MEPEKDLIEQQEQANQKEGLQQTNKNGQEILNGAHETDQLDQFKKNMPEGGRDAYPDLQQGAQPSEGDQ